MSQSGNRPWGHKLTLSIYMEGGIENVEAARQCLEAQVMIVPSPAFVGEWIDVVQEKPVDQGGS